jgi:hypothetical protein
MADVLKDKIVKTRKEQVCWGCAEKFEKGSKLRVITVVDGGDFTTTYWCRICDVTYQEHTDYIDDNIRLGEVKEWDSWYDNTRLLPRTY